MFNKFLIEKSWWRCVGGKTKAKHRPGSSMISWQTSPRYAGENRWYFKGIYLYKLTLGLIRYNSKLILGNWSLHFSRSLVHRVPSPFFRFLCKSRKSCRHSMVQTITITTNTTKTMSKEKRNPLIKTDWKWLKERVWGAAFKRQFAVNTPTTHTPTQKVHIVPWFMYNAGICLFPSSIVPSTLDFLFASISPRQGNAPIDPPHARANIRARTHTHALFLFTVERSWAITAARCWMTNKTSLCHARARLISGACTTGWGRGGEGRRPKARAGFKKR